MLPQHMLRPRGRPITLTDTAPIEFTAPAEWKSIGASISADISGMARARYKEWSASPSVAATLALDISNPLGNLADDLYVASGEPIVVAKIEPIEFAIPNGH